VVWIVSSSGRSGREQTLAASFERRISPLILGGFVRCRTTGLAAEALVTLAA